MAARHIVVVFGYGCHLVPELKGYLDRVVRFVNERKPDYLFLCGGPTQRKSAPGVSEAGLMRSYLIPRLNYIPGLMFLWEENSYTTPDNAEKTAWRIKEERLMDGQTELTVFCEATRALKVDLLVRHFLGRRANIETASWELMSPEKQIIGTLYDWAAIRFPPLARYFRNKRLQRAEQI